MKNGIQNRESDKRRHCVYQRKINEIVPREVDAAEEEFVLKVENEAGEIIGGCFAEAYEYHWARVLLNVLWVDER